MSKKKIEKILYDYTILKSQIEMKIVGICSRSELSAVRYDQPNGGKTNNIHSSVEDLIMAKIEKEEELSNMIARKKKIEASLKCLNVREIKAIQMKYFKEEKVVNIAFELGVDSTTTVYNYINRAIEKLKKAGLAEICI